MKKLAMILAVAFTMGLGASTVSATTKDKTKTTKAKTECPEAKKADCAKKDAKPCCAAKKAEVKEVK